MQKVKQKRENPLQKLWLNVIMMRGYIWKVRAETPMLEMAISKNK